MLLNFYRRLRIAGKRCLRIEPTVPVELRVPLEFHGNDYCGWAIPAKSLDCASVVVDVGLGEDISFSVSLVSAYGCTVHGFDPTPRAIAYVRELQPQGFVLHECGVGANSGPATFYLPNNEEHISGSLVREGHVGRRQIDVQLLSLADVFSLIGAERIALLKIDIEGAEYELIDSRLFRQYARRIDMICVEFHHRWMRRGREATLAAVETLKALGFRCAWGSATTNEEFLFVNKHSNAG